MLDGLDKRILLALRKDGLVTNIALARELGINAVTVAKRIDRMLHENIFVIRAVPNPYKMGYRVNAFIALDVDLKHVNSICGKLVEYPNVSSVLTTFGRFDIIIILDSCNWEMLLAFIKEEISQIAGIKRIRINFVSEIKKRSYSIFENHKSADDENVQIDEIDRRIVEELEKNGKVAYHELARNLKISSATVSRRIASLLRNKAIKIVALPNPANLGFNINSVITLSADASKVNDICSELAGYPEVHTIMTLINNFEIILGVHFPTSKMLHDFVLEKIAHIDGVLNVETLIRAELKKSYYIPEFVF
ncbi:Lrp/AsnC family transcriptional regulator [Chloroflexota bacterium]